MCAAIGRAGRGAGALHFASRFSLQISSHGSDRMSDVSRARARVCVCDGVMGRWRDGSIASRRAASVRPVWLEFAFAAAPVRVRARTFAAS